MFSISIKGEEEQEKESLLKEYNGCISRGFLS
jgi:hypothetical protein